VIAHENAHFLFLNSDPKIREALRRIAQETGRERALELLHEALPTALGQGVAARRFEPGWSEDRPWYHREDVDRYAKTIYPLVEQALDGERPRLDEPLMRELLERWEPTPRSP
jgi:hypothetical protein